MITRGIRDYMSRDWQAARSSKDAYWAERIARLGPGEGLLGPVRRNVQSIRIHGFPTSSW